MSRTERPSRTSINGTRHILNVQGKEPGYEYRFVLDQGDRIRQMEERGYEIVRDKTVKVGDKRVSNPTADGTPVQVSGGGGTTLYLMRIKSDWYLEDQATKQKQVDDIEASMKAAAAEQGLYGKLEITRS
jgi:hypothetical protein